MTMLSSPIFSDTGWHLPVTYSLDVLTQVLDPLTTATMNLAATPIRFEECERWHAAGWLPGPLSRYERPTPLHYVWLRALQYLEALETSPAIVARLRKALFAPWPPSQALASPQEVAAALQWQRRVGFPPEECDLAQAAFADPAYRDDVAREVPLTELERVLSVSLVNRAWVGVRYYASQLVLVSIEGSPTRAGEAIAPHLYLPLTLFLLEMVDPAQWLSFGVKADSLSPGEQALLRTVREGAFKQLLLQPRHSKPRTHLDMLVTTHREWSHDELPTTANLRVPPHGQLTLRRHRDGGLYVEVQTRQQLD